MGADSADNELDGQPDLDDPSGRLARYLGVTQTPLDVLALLTLWIVVVPPGKFDSPNAAWVARLVLSGIYAIDYAIRTALARRHWRYIRTHLFGVAVVLAPPLRILFSLRLIRSLFRRGNLEWFLLAASLLVLDGAAIVYLYERHASGSNIHTVGQSLWWSVVTVSTVGYGDYYPVTVGGQIAAGFIMAIGILVLAVVTAQVASSFVDQSARNRPTAPPAESGVAEATLADLASRLARIEQLLMARSTGSE